MKLALVFAAAAHAATITRWHTASTVITTVYDTTTYSTQPPLTATPVTEAETSSEIETLTSSSATSTVSVSTSLSTSSTYVPTTLVTKSSSATTSTASTASSSDSSASSLSSFESAILEETNTKRALHSAPALTWNTTLAQYAADYAASNFDCDNVKLVHSGGPYGENLAAGYVGGAAPVDAWYDEISDYDFSNPGYSSATGHFTQLVWVSTKQMGCARVMCDNAWRQYTICEYSPAGNVVGTTAALTAKYFSENVLES